MKAIVGIDPNAVYRSALQLLARLNFEQLSVELLHADEPPLVGGEGVSPFIYNDYEVIEEAIHEQAKKLLTEAKHAADDRGFSATIGYGIGNACQALVERADESGADLIVVGSEHKSRYGAFFLGSVGRGLTIGAHQSLLIVKREATASSPLTAVFATDGSAYSDMCLHQLVDMAPRGIGKIAVLTAVGPHESDESLVAHQGYIDRMVAFLTENGISADGHVVKGHPHEVIDATMTSLKADLLILGARGHGLLERMFVGSVSLQEVVGTPFSVLLLRRK